MLILQKENFELQFNLSKFIPLMIVSFVMIPLQTTGEEILFRGYLAQGVAGLTRNRWLAIIIPSVLFGLMHSFNPEIQEFGFFAVMPQYLMFGLLFGLTAVLDDGIELAMGMHAANNIFLSLFFTSPHSVLLTDAVFNQTVVNVHQDTISLVALCLVAVIFFAWKYKWNFRLLNQKVEPIELN